MHLSDSAVALSSEELGVFGKTGPAELPFVNVQRYLARLSDAVPDIYARSADATMLLSRMSVTSRSGRPFLRPMTAGAPSFRSALELDRRSAGARAR